MRTKNKCDCAVLVNSKTRPDLNGKTIHAKYIKSSNYTLYKDNAYKCCGCGAKMVLSHRKDTYYFRALNSHSKPDCIYNHGEVTKKISLYDGTEFDYLSIINKTGFVAKQTSSKILDSSISKEESTSENNKEDYEFVTKKKNITNLEKFYSYEQQSDLDATFGETTVGKFFITSKTLKANTIVDYNGPHFFVGVPFNINSSKYKDISSYINDNLPHNNIFTIGSEEHWKTITKSKRTYLSLIFSEKSIYEDFFQNFNKVKGNLAKGKYEVKILVVQNLEVKDECENFTILACTITNKRQYKIIRESKN